MTHGVIWENWGHYDFADLWDIGPGNYYDSNWPLDSSLPNYNTPSSGGGIDGDGTKTWTHPFPKSGQNEETLPDEEQDFDENGEALADEDVPGFGSGW